MAFHTFQKISFIVLACLSASSSHTMDSLKESAKRSYSIYLGNLYRRQDKPETEDEFHELKNAAGDYGDLLRKQGHSDPYALERQVSDDLWKKSWGDKNPITRDLLIAGGVATAAAIICKPGPRDILPFFGVTCAALGICALIPNPIVYWNNVKRRQNNAENEHDFFARKEAASNYGDILRRHGNSTPYALENQISNDGWNKTLFDRHPISRDSAIAVSTLSLITLAGWIAIVNIEPVRPGEIPLPGNRETLRHPWDSLRNAHYYCACLYDFWQ